MKNSERALYNDLFNKEITDNDILSNVKNGLGNLKYVSGNPMTKTEIVINVSLWFQNIATGLRVLPAALPAAAQTVYPFYIFGLTDFYGGFRKLQTLIPLSNGWINNLGSTGIVNYTIGLVIPVFVGAVSGDMVISLVNATLGIRCYVLIHCNNVSYGTFLQSFVSDLIIIDTIRYIVPIANITQFTNPLVFGYQSLFGNTYSDNVDPRMFITSKDFQQQISDIPINLPIDKGVMLGSYINFDCTNISFLLFVKEVKALTFRNK